MEGMGVTAFWTDRPTFVTGATGFLGGWLVSALVACGADVVCLVRDLVPDRRLRSPGSFARVRIVRGDVCDQPLTERVLGEYEIDTVFHLAAQAVVGTASRNPLSTFETNIRGTWTVLEACRRSPAIRQVVVASSDKAYGSQSILPYHEDMALQGRYPYDASKSCADLIAQSYAATYGLPVIISRCANLYGGGDFNWNRLVPGTARAVLRGERPIIRSNGRMLRDYMYVEDGVMAYLTLAEALGVNRELAGRAFNFGHREPIRVLSLVEMILDICQRKDLTPDVRNEAEREIADQYLDASRARIELGWETTCTHEVGLSRTVEWYREFMKRPPGQ